MTDDHIQENQTLLQKLSNDLYELDAMLSVRNQQARDTQMELEQQQRLHQQQLQHKQELTAAWQRLEQQHEQMLARMAEARNNERLLVNEIDQQRGNCAQSYAARQEAMAARLALAEDKYKACLINSSNLNSAIEKSLSRYKQQQQQLSDAVAQHNKQQQSLQNSFIASSNDLSAEMQRMQERQQALLAERDAAAAALEQAQHDLEESQQALAQNEDDIAARRSQLQQLKQESREHEEQNRAKTEVAGTAAKAAEERFSQLMAEKKTELEKARALSRVALRATQEAEAASQRCQEKLRQFYAQADQQTAAFAQQLEQAQQKLTAKRDAVNELRRSQQGMREKIQQHQQEELECSHKVAQLREEAQELNNVAAAAADLANDATTSRRKASSDVSPIMAEMEEALIASARDAANEAKKKHHELRRAEYEKRVAGNNILRCQRELEVLIRQQELANSECQTAERELYGFTRQLEQRTALNYTADPQIQQVLQDYEQTLQQAREQKQAADVAGENLRRIRSELERLGRNFVESSRQSQAALSKCEQDRLAEQERYLIDINTQEAQLRVAEEKQEHLSAIVSERNRQQSELRAALAEKQYVIDKAAAQLQAVSTQVETDMDALRRQIGDQQEQATAGLDKIRRQAHDSSDEYTALLLQSVQSARATIVAKKALQALNDEAYALREQIRLQQQSEEDEYSNRLGKAEQECADIQSQLEQLRDEILAANQRVNDCEQAANDIAESQDRTRQGLEQIHAELAELREQRQQLMEQKNAALAEAERLAEEQRQAEAEAAAEQARLAAEAAAAALAAELEAARLAEEEQEAERIAAAAAAAAAQAAAEEEERLAQQQAIRLAVGDVLSKEENLLLIDREQMEDRIKRMKQQLIQELEQEDYTYVPESELELSRRDAEKAQNRTLDSAALYESAKRTAANLAQQLQQCQQEAGQLHERRQRQEEELQRAKAEQDTMRWIGSELERLGKQGASTQYLNMYESWQSSAAGNDELVEKCTRQLLDTQQALKENSSNSAELENSLSEAREMLYELACVWIYDENQNTRAQYRKKEIERSVEKRKLNRNKDSKRFKK